MKPPKPGNMWVKQRSEFGIMELDSVDSFELGPRPLVVRCLIFTGFRVYVSVL